MRHARTIMLVTLLALLVGCEKKDGAASDLYKFKRAQPAVELDYKEVSVRIAIDYKLQAAGGPAVGIENPHFFLHAYMHDEAQTQVVIRKPDEAPRYDYPIELTGTNLEFDAIVHVPLVVKEGDTGYTFRFALVERNSLGLTEEVDRSTVKNLEALRTGMIPGMEPAANRIDLSLATTLAYRILREATPAGTPTASVEAYTQLLGAIVARLKSVEEQIDTSSNPDLATFASTVLAGIKYEIMRDQELQASISSIITKAAPASATVVEAFAKVLESFATEVKATIGTTTTSEAKILKVPLDQTTLASVTTHPPIVFAPALAFTDTDTDSTLAGSLAIDKPKSSANFDTYVAYFGGDDLANAKLAKIDSAVPSAERVSIALAKGTRIPAGATRFWVFLEAAGQPLAARASLAITNLVEQGPPTLAIEGTTNTPGWTRARALTAKLGADPTATGWCLLEEASDATPTRPTATSCGGGAWLTERPTTFALTGHDGERRVSAWLLFADGLVSEKSGSATIKLDTTPPAPSFDAPAAATDVGLTDLRVTCETGATTSYAVDEGISTVLSCTTSPLTFKLPQATSDGSRTVSVSQTDAAGNVGTATRTFNVDMTSPTAPVITTPVSAATIMLPTYAFVWTVPTDAGVGLATATPAYAVDVYQTADCSGSVVSTTALSATTHTVTNIADEAVVTIKVRAFDVVGNASTSACSPAVRRRATPPVTRIAGTTETSLFRSPDETIDVEVVDLPPAWQACAGRTQTTTPSVAACSDNWSATAPTLVTLPATQGEYTIYVWFKAPDGVIATPRSRPVQVDLAPNVALTAPANTARVPATITAAVTCDPDTDVTFTGDITTKTIPCAANGTATTSLTPTGADESTATITATQTDVFGRSAADSRSVTVDLTPPLVTITGPADGSTTDISGKIALTASCEASLDVVIAYGGSSVTKPCANDGTLATNVYFPAPDGQHTVTLTQTDAAGNSTSDSGTYERFSARIMARNVMIEPATVMNPTEKIFYIGISATNPNVWSYSFDQNTPGVTTFTTPNNGFIEVYAADSPHSFKYTPAVGFVGTETVTLWARDNVGHLISATVELEVDATISTVQPVLSVRATGCLVCHGKIKASMITDFGYGDPWYAGGAPPVYGNFTGNNHYGDHAENWRTAKVEGQLITPKTTAIHGTTSTLIDYLAMTAGSDYFGTGYIPRTSQIPSVYIGAPTAARIRQVAGLYADGIEHTAFFKNTSSSPALAGLTYDAVNDYYRNDGILKCYGDLAIDGVLLLRDLQLETDDAGCRIYATESVHVQGPITYLGTHPGRHLQLSSASSINMGLGSSLDPAVTTNGCNGAVHGSNNSFNARYKHGQAETFYTRRSGFSGSAVNLLHDEIIAQGARISSLKDAVCYAFDTDFERLLLNAPYVHNRYHGDMKGMLVSEIALFALGDFKFEYDPVFDGKSLLPLLSRSNWIKINTGASDNARIARLRTNEGNIGFSPGGNTFDYDFNGVMATLSFWAQPSDEGSTMTINGQPFPKHAWKNMNPIAPGLNTFTIVVTAADGTTTNTYTLNATRRSWEDSSLVSLDIGETLTPAFQGDTLSYAATVPNGTTAITVTPTKLPTGTDVLVNGVELTTASTVVNLNVGANTITVKSYSESEHNDHARTYTIVVTRAP